LKNILESCIVKQGIGVPHWFLYLLFNYMEQKNFNEF
jgi:hypothetical protein